MFIICVQKTTVTKDNYYTITIKDFYLLTRFYEQ